ncbi:MAG: anthranilate synthase component II [Desulfovibrionales bacterium]
MILILVNFDSFTFNLVQVLQTLGADPLVFRNNEEEIFRYAGNEDLEGVIVSPGPGHPRNTGLCSNFLSILPRHVPVLGVCLGHQLLGWMAGCEVDRGERIMHGKTSMVTHTGNGLFTGLPNPMQVCRYHSLVIKKQCTAAFDITAWTDQGEIMGLCYREKPWLGVQFHPESILSPDGPGLLDNFLSICRETRRSIEGGVRP